MNTVASLPAQWREAVRTVYGQGPTGAATLKCASELEAALALPAPSAGVGVDGRKDGRAGIDRLWDSQWVNIVNAPEVLNAESTEDAVNIAVRMTEQKMAENHAALQHPAAPSVSPSVAGDAGELHDFTEWLAREMPPGTVISDPRWWAPRIARRLATAEQPAINPSQCPKCKAWPIDADACGYCGNPKPFIQELQK